MEKFLKYRKFILIMKNQLTSLDLHYLITEIKNDVENAILRKVYQTDDILILQLYKPAHGTIELALSGRFVALLNYKLPRPEKPTNFAMLLRKHLRGKRVVDFYQHGFDRVVVVAFEDYMVVCEILPKPNIMLVGKQDMRLWSAMIKKNLHFRELKIHKEYAFPEPPIDPRELSCEDFIEILKKEANKTKIVSFLAQKLPLSGKYAEEVCLRAGVDKDVGCEKIGKAEAERVLSAIKELFDHKNTSPAIIFDREENMVDVVPIDMAIYRNARKTKFNSFNDAVNEYFVSMIKQEIMEKEKKQKSKYSIVERLEHRMKQQLRALKLYEKREEMLREAGNKIYEYYDELSGLVEKMKRMDFKDIAHMQNVIRTDPRKKEVVIKLDDVEIVLALDKSLNECAAMHYEEAKKMKRKISRVKDEIERTKKELEEAQKKEKEMEKKVDVEIITPKKEKKKIHWYEKFRWFFTSKGKLVVCGKDATTNEILIKKYMEKEDLVFHADYPGSPFGLLKHGRNNADLQELMETAQFVACFSRAWKEGVSALKVFYVYPEQVSKKTPAGEYIKKGAFMIYGEKNWLKVEMKLAAVFRDNEIFVLPALSIKDNERYVFISPGHLKPKQLAEKIIAKLRKMVRKQEAEVLERYKVDELIQKLPAGGGIIVRK